MDPKAWLQFALRCVRNDIHELRVKWSWDYIRQRRDDRRAYIRLWKIQKSGSKLSIEDSALLFQLDRKLSYEDLRFYRSMATSQLRKEKMLLATAAVSSADPAVAASSKTWSEYLWGSEASATTASDSQTVFTQDQMKQLFETIEYDPDAEESVGSKVPRDVLLVI
jgi:vacuolar protein sorting-associated protein 13A/C